MWTNERVAELTRLFNEGLSGGKIGKQMGVSRNSVIGKCGRLGLTRTEAATVANRARASKERQIPWSPTRVRKEREEEQRRVTARARPQLKGTKSRPLPQIAQGLSKPIEELVSEAPTSPVTFSGLRNRMCRWPSGDPRHADFRFCGARATGESYCAQHMALAYAPRAA